MNLSNVTQTAVEGLDRLKALLAIGQHKRLLQIETALPSATLAVERARWQENVSGLGQRSPALSPLVAEVDCLSTSVLLSLKALIGEQMSLRLLCADGRYRTWHGYVAEAAQLGADGGLARYRLKLVAFTHFLSLRHDTRVFLAQRPDEIVSAVLSAYPQANFRFELSPETLEATARRGTTTQYRESDAAFVQRLLSEEGWNWRLEHSDNDRPLSEAKAARHCLVITDSSGPRPDLGALRFGRPDLRQGGLVAEDTLTAIALSRRVVPNAVTLASWDPRQLSGVGAQHGALAVGHAPTLEHYQGHGERRYSRFESDEDTAHTPLAEQRSGLMLARHELTCKTLSGEGAVRRMEPGADFQLTDHSRYPAGTSDNRFVVLAVQHEAANNLGSEAAQLLARPELEAGSYRQKFQAVPAALRLVPDTQPKPRAPGVQTALVVGHEDQPLTTDRDLRVRVQFPWQRGTLPVAGGLPAPTTPGQAPTGHAPGNASASQWVRVAQPSAGANWGAVFMPRVGTEVLVDFVEGDLDRPMIVGQLYNGTDSLPWPAGEESGANHPGTLSGWRSHTLEDGGLNEWVIDDATGQLRMRLASQSSGSPWSELSLGHIVNHGANSSQRGAWLGSGFYAHTDGWASVRAAQGLLFSATTRAGSYGSAQGGQMDTQEAVAQLKGAQQLGRTLGQAARAQGALPLSSHDASAQQAWHGLLQAIDIEQSGRHPTARQGPHRDAQNPVAQFAKPYVVLDTPSAAMAASPAAIAAYSGQDTSLVAQADVHAAAAHTASLVAGGTASLYTHEGELQAIAANGRLSLRAHTDALELLADQDITVVSVNDEISITAKQRIEIVGGDSKVVLNGADIEFATPGSFTVKAASHAWGGGVSTPAEISALPEGQAGKLNHYIEIERRYYDGSPVVGAMVKAVFSDGSMRRGTLDSKGMLHIDGVKSGLASIEIGEDAREWTPDRVDEGSANPAYGRRITPEQAAQLYVLFQRSVP